MDYIERAVERVAGGQNSAAVEQSAPIDFGRSGHRGTLALEQIEYTSTRRIQPDAATLLENRVLTEGTEDAVVGAYKVLRTRVLKRMQQNGWNTLAVTSASAMEGKSLTAINLAISLAMKLDYSVLLADLDFYHPTIHTYFGFEPQYGVSDHLCDDVPIEEIFIHPGIDRLVLLPGKRRPERSSELLSSPKMTALVEELKSRYQSRLVLFDMPPVLVGDDVLAFSSLADATLLVVEEGRTQTDDLEKVASLLQDVNLMGSVLNKSAEKSAMGKGYGYYY